MNDKQIVHFASTKHNSEQVNSMFGTAQKNYVKAVLTSLFDLTEIKQIRSDIAGFLVMHKTKINADGFEWANNLFVKLDSLHEVASRFQHQLGALTDRAVDMEQDQELQERIKKAAIYFEGEFENCLNILKEFSLRTESKEAANDLNENLQNIFENIYQKKNLLATCKKGFNFSDFVKNKLNLKYPDLKINIYASAKNTKVSSEIKNPGLYRKLLLLRDEICNEEQKIIYLVAKNKSLQELSEFLPTKEEHLLQISGFGKATCEKYGERFLKVVRDYMEENNLHDNMDAKPGKKKRKEKTPKAEANPDEAGSEKKTNTKEETYKLYKKGLKLEEIAKQRGFALSTVEGHLTPYISSGELNVDYLVSREKQKIILAALENFDKGSGITPIKNVLPENISYSEIRYMVAFKSRK